MSYVHVTACSPKIENILFHAHHENLIETAKKLQSFAQWFQCDKGLRSTLKTKKPQAHYRLSVLLLSWFLLGGLSAHSLLIGGILEESAKQVRYECVICLQKSYVFSLFTMCRLLCCFTCDPLWEIAFLSFCEGKLSASLLSPSGPRTMLGALRGVSTLRGRSLCSMKSRWLRTHFKVW